MLSGYGLSFNLPNDGRNIVKFQRDFTFFESIMNENLSTLEGFILNSAIAPRNEFKLPKCLMLVLEHLRKNKGIVITKADKGYKVVVLNTVDYEHKLIELISDNSIYEICNNNPLKIWQQSYNRNLKNYFEGFTQYF